MDKFVKILQKRIKTAYEVFEESYLEIRRELKEEEIYISLYDESQNIDTLEYKKQLEIDSISPSEGKAFFMRLVEKPVQNFYNTANSFRFKILVE